MKPIIVSGNISTGKPSSVIDTLCNHLPVTSHVFNGVLPKGVNSYVPTITRL